ncbi:ATP-binding cassette domain-containing protein [Proteiniclasticum sp. BAD-10]|uniref:ATP-binding cassette domain-containing protein n=1 Tax=Proteiniclasticum sediminis TaxID=2804028 RepID=A0A941CNR5_9CLOT|nr:oligopeptide/dipeptide ABC transporter ATP-binding protein [Proteiniclasticum sediminis]MBR0575048.1 ATP-binding cassette domain-containing protein [Proteiniclasticum sediminis]
MENQKEILYEVKNLKTHFPIKEGFFNKVTGHVKAVDNVSLEIYRGETLGIVGESGCGKTTLGKTLMMLQKPTEGELIYHVDGQEKDLTKVSKEELFNFRKKVQMVFQDPYSSLNPLKNIYEAFEEPLKVHGYKTKAERETIMQKVVQMVNLLPEYLYRYPHEFSGGQRQRLCIARVLQLSPELIIFDEPVSALDVSIQAQVLNLVRELQKELNLTYVFIAHDLSVVQYMSDRIIVMYLGKIVEIAESNELVMNSLHPYTSALLSAVPVPEVGGKMQRIILEGDVPSPINKPSGCPFRNRCRYAMDICAKEEPVLLKKENGHQVACHLYDPTKGDRHA